MKIAICDDDSEALSLFSALAGEYAAQKGKLLTCSPFTEGVTLLDAVRKGSYDAVVLDILMPGLNGMQIAKEIRTFNLQIKIIFLTSSSEFAVDSYGVSAYHYLLKPIKTESLYSLFDRLFAAQGAEGEESFLVKSKAGICRLSFCSLCYIEIINRTLYFHFTDGGVLEAVGSLSDLEEKLLGRSEFFKIHRSYLVNLNCIKTLGQKAVLMEGGQCLPVSRGVYGTLKEVYMSYMFAQKGVN